VILAIALPELCDDSEHSQSQRDPSHAAKKARTQLDTHGT